LRALAGLLVLAGATAGSLGIRRWQFVTPQVRSLGRCFAGDLLMGQGARLIPGGHDLLLLWTIPGLAWHGLAMPQAPTGSVIPSIRPIASAGVSIMPGTNALPSVAPLPSTSPVA
jgi:hypothetical protein